MGRLILRCTWSAEEAQPDSPVWPAEPTRVWAGPCARSQEPDLYKKPDPEPHVGPLAGCERVCSQQAQEGKALEPRRGRPWFCRTVALSPCCRAGTAHELLKARHLRSGKHDRAAAMCMAPCACNHHHVQQQRSSFVLKGIYIYIWWAGWYKGWVRRSVLSFWGREQLLNWVWVITLITKNSTRPSVWARYIYRITHEDFFLLHGIDVIFLSLLGPQWLEV